MLRRKFLKNASLLSLGLGCAGCVTGEGLFDEVQTIKNPKLVQKLSSIPKIFCTAYITPDAPGQENQEHMVAKYPIAIVPQDNRKHFRQWRDRVRMINPDIILLAYQMVVEETTVPGPGHDVLRKTTNSWAKYPGGILPTVGPSHKKRRIFDPRKSEWQRNFLQGCDETLFSDGYDGLFLDQCTVFPKSHPSPFVRADMEESLQLTLLQLRTLIPDRLIVGNCRNNWAGLNGAMNENRIKDFIDEVGQPSGQVLPKVDLLQTRLQSLENHELVTAHLAIAQQHGAFYSAAVDYQHVPWFDVYDEL